MSDSARIEQLRAEGNALVSAKQYAQAIDKYSEGLAAVAAAAGTDDAAALDTQRVLLWSNRAMCYLQLQAFDDAVRDCSSALEKDPKNEKARYRRAQAFVGLGSMAQAFTDIRLVLQLNANNKAAVALARKIKDAVQDDVHGVQKALDAVVSGVDCDAQTLVALQPKTVEALAFLEMKCSADLASLPRELERKGGVAVLWRVVAQLLALFNESSSSNTPATTRPAVSLLLSHAVALLAVVASASLELAALVLDRSGPATLNALIALLHAHVAREYNNNSNSSSDDLSQLSLAGCKAIVKLCAFVFKHLMLTASNAEDAMRRRVLTGLLDGLRSRSLALQVTALDGLLHFLSIASIHAADQVAATNVKATTLAFATLANELGVFALLHATAASALRVPETTDDDATTRDVLLSRLPLVFTQCLAPFEGNDALLQSLVVTQCVTPILKASVSDRSSLESATASCVLLSALFLSNAKLALWAVQSAGETSNEASGSRLLDQLHKFLVASRTFTTPQRHTRQLQELWVDCVASVCGVEHGTASVPSALRLEIYKLLNAAVSDADLVLQASALSIHVKLAVVEKTLDVASADSQRLFAILFDVLERAHAFDAVAIDHQRFWSGASPKERAIEALSYVITLTPVKDAFVQRPQALASVFAIDFASSTTSKTQQHRHVGYRANVYYGVAYVLHHVLTSEAALKKKQMDTMEMSAEQYDELQKALKQKSVLDDGDAPERVASRVAAVLASPQTLQTLVQLLKIQTTNSLNVVEMATQSALHAAEVPAMRGAMVQSGVFHALLPLALHATAATSSNTKQPKQPSSSSKLSLAAGQAVAKILISTNPHLVPHASLLSSIRPLLELCKSELQLLQFEALMALTNIASVSETTKQRIVSEPHGLATLQYLQFSEHELVRRAATEAICNLLPTAAVIKQIFLNPEKVRLWLALASYEEEVEDFETARAAAGAIAMVSQWPHVSWLLLAHGGLTTMAHVLTQSPHDASLQRAMFAIENMLLALQASDDDVRGPIDTEKDDDKDEDKETLATQRRAFVAEVETHRAVLTARLEQLVVLPRAVTESARDDGGDATAVNDAAQSLLDALRKVGGEK